jgi:nucleotide-binding universal stress UspA family protein
MFNKVIWATDGSEAADRALPLARTLAAESGAPLLVVYCEEFTMAGKGGSFPVHANERDVEAKVERQVSELSGESVTATLEIGISKAGGAAHVIADVAAQEHADVIVVGTRGRTALTGLLLGSVTQRLLHIAPCPVLAVPASNGAGA